MPLEHHTFTGAQLHLPGYIQAGDPGAVGAGKLWFNTTSKLLKIRNAADAAWDAVQIDAADLATGTLAAARLPSTADMNARVGVRKNSAGSTFLRRRLNLIEGTGMTITVADDSTDEEVDVTLASSGGGGGGGAAFIGRAVASSSASLTVTGITSAFDTVLVVLNGIIPATNGAFLWIRMTNSGTPDTGAVYGYDHFGWRQAGSILGGAQSGATKWVTTVGGISNNAAHGTSMSFFLFNCASASKWKEATGKSRLHDSTGIRSVYDFGATYESASVVNGVQILMDTGNIASGELSLVGINNS